MTSSASHLKIRDATQADVPAVVALYADDALGAARERPTDPLPQEYWQAFAAIDQDDRHRLVVVEDDHGQVVATVQLSYLPHLVRTGAERAQIEAVRVHASRRGTGLGRELVQWAIDQARERGCALIQLTTDAGRSEAHRFYESLDFVASHVSMKLDLR